MMTRRSLIKRVGQAGLLLAASLAMAGQTNARKRDARPVLVIGAGAAGLAAARYLMDGGQVVTVLEARSRPGGRVHTAYDMAAHPVELGAEFIHGDRVLTWDWVRQARLVTVGSQIDSEQNSFIYYGGQLRLYADMEGLPDLSILEIDTTDLDVETLLHRPDTATAPEDMPFGALVDQHYPALSAEARRLYDQVISSEYGAGIDQLGVAGLAEATYDNDGEGNFRIVEGYSRLIDAMARGLDIRYQQVVTRIAYGAEGVQVTTEDGQQYDGAAVVVTLPLAVLQAGAVEFSPPLPQATQAAIDGLGSGKVNKLILRFDRAFWPAAMEGVSTSGDSQFWWRPGWGRPNETPTLTALMGGAAGERYSAMSQDEAIAAGLADLTEIFKRDDLAERLVSGRFVNWGADPFSLMGYSHVPVGAAGLREVLAQPVANVLHFAGEATHPLRPATVHGALESGIRAATLVRHVPSV